MREKSQGRTVSGHKPKIRNHGKSRTTRTSSLYTPLLYIGGKGRHVELYLRKLLQGGGRREATISRLFLLRENEKGEATGFEFIITEGL